MHLLFINPQGNFDPADSFLTEHPDFGGQLVYVKEVAQALVKLGHKVDIATRLIIDDAWPQFSEPKDSIQATKMIYVFCGSHVEVTSFWKRRNCGHIWMNL